MKESFREQKFTEQLRHQVQNPVLLEGLEEERMGLQEQSQKRSEISIAPSIWHMESRLDRRGFLEGLGGGTENRAHGKCSSVPTKNRQTLANENCAKIADVPASAFCNTLCTYSLFLVWMLNESWQGCVWRGYPAVALGQTHLLTSLGECVEKQLPLKAVFVQHFHG